jgi:ABC-type transporter Mla subunit MlaD
MSDGFHVSPSALNRLAGTFADQQQPFQRLCGPVQQRAGAVDTGDPALDADTRRVMDLVSSVFQQFGEGVARTGTVLDEIAADYQATDGESADQQVEIAEADLGAENVGVPAVRNG